MLRRTLITAISAFAIFASLLVSSARAGQEQYGPKVEPPAMGSDYQPLMWRGSDAAFALDTVGFGTCQIESSGLAASKSSNPDLQQIAAHSMDVEQREVKKLKSMAKVIDFRFPDTKKYPVPCAENGILSALSGANLDKAYLDYLSKDTAAAVARFQVEAEAQANSANFNLRKFAAANMPDLTEQQHSIDDLRSKLEDTKK